MSEISEKKCGECGRTKSVELFRKAATHLGGDGYRQKCRLCEDKGRASKAGIGEEHQAADEIPTDAPSCTVGMQLGFKAHFDGTDLVVEQESGEGKATLWLSLYEVARLAEFADRLALKRDQLTLPGLEGAAG